MTTNATTGPTNVTPYLSTEDAALYLRQSVSALYKLCSKRKISYYKPNGKDNFYLKEDLDIYLTSIRIASRAEIEEQIKKQNERKNELKNNKKKKRG